MYFNVYFITSYFKTTYNNPVCILALEFNYPFNYIYIYDAKHVNKRKNKVGDLMNCL